MKPRTLAFDMPLTDLVEEILYTRSLLRAHPFLANLAAQLDPLHGEWTKLQQDELALTSELLDAEARIVAIDNGFDFLCVAISATLLAEAGGDRKAPSYQRYFGAAPPNKLKRPVLGEQLEVMRTWVPSLTSEQNSLALQAYGKQLAERVIEADAAVRALSEAQRKRADFEAGPRKAFVDKLNAQRQVLYGQLAELRHRRPELNLTSDFATHFFVRDTRNRRLSVPELEQLILRERARLRKHEAELARLVEDEAETARLRADEELAEAEEELAALEQHRDALTARLTALRAQQKSR